MSSKICLDCKIEKDLSDFPKNRAKFGGFGQYCLLCNNIRATEWRKRNPDKKREADKRRNIKAHGLTIKEYERLTSSGICQLCGGLADRLEIDHDHSCCPGKYGCRKCVRGVICHRCNVNVVVVLEDQNLVESGIRYLKNRPASRIFQ